MRKCRCRVVTTVCLISTYQIMMTTTTTTMMMISCVNMCICQVYFTINLLTCLSNCYSRLVARGRIACRITLRMSTARMPGLVPACLRQKYPFPWRIRAPLNTWFLGPRSPHRKQHLDRFSRFITAHSRDQQTDRQDRPHDDGNST